MWPHSAKCIDREMVGGHHIYQRNIPDWIGGHDGVRWRQQLIESCLELGCLDALISRHTCSYRCCSLCTCSTARNHKVCVFQRWGHMREGKTRRRQNSKQDTDLTQILGSVFCVFRRLGDTGSLFMYGVKRFKKTTSVALFFFFFFTAGLQKHLKRYE